jgi:hypothetical protein
MHQCADKSQQLAGFKRMLQVVSLPYGYSAFRTSGRAFCEKYQLKWSLLDGMTGSDAYVGVHHEENFA